jgi:tubulin-specific chaperone B
MVSLQINDRLTLGERFRGTVKYMGKIDSKEGEWIGLRLDEPYGANDGTVAGRRYFECEDKHGLFVKYDTIRRGLIRESEDAMEKTKKSRAESRIRSLEETIATLEALKNNELERLRNENAELKRTVMELSGQLKHCKGYCVTTAPERDLGASIKEAAAKSMQELARIAGLTAQLERSVKEAWERGRLRPDSEERRRVWYLVSQIVDGAVENDVNKISRHKKEFESIMKRYNIAVE